MSWEENCERVKVGQKKPTRIQNHIQHDSNSLKQNKTKQFIHEKPQKEST